MRLYLDTEWQNEAEHELVSLALVTEDGESFYAERDPLPSGPSAFAKEVVYPLLDRGSWAFSDAAFTAALREFLARFEHPPVVADAAMDFMLLACALNGFGQPGLSLPPPWRPMVITFGDVSIRIEDYFEDRPEAKAKRHHARIDAQALRWAFEELCAPKKGAFQANSSDPGSR